LIRPNARPVKIFTRKFMLLSELIQIGKREQETPSQLERSHKKASKESNKTQRVENGSDTSESTSKREMPELPQSLLLLKKLLLNNETFSPLFCSKNQFD